MVLRIFEQALRRARIAGLVGAVVVVGNGCANISGSLPDILPTPSRDELRAGAAKLDITPPPGFPMGGHSIAGQISRGYWVRLQVRSIFLESPNGEKIALVSADLWSFPSGLGDRVAELIGKSGSPGCQLRRDQLILAATHTHQSPGNFSSSFLYNAFASSEVGFDAELFDFLANQIADSVRLSCENAIPALLRFNATEISGLARNRSMEAFRGNPEANAIFTQNSNVLEGETSVPYPDKKAFRAIYPILQALWLFDARDPDNVIGVAAFVALHPTAMSHDTPVYSSDVFGIGSIEAERHLLGRSADRAPVVAIFNGAEGDVSPIWYAQDRRETVQLGELLGDQIARLTAEGSWVLGDIDHRFEEKLLADSCYSAGNSSKFCTTPLPLGGPAALGGAEDGRTWLYDWGCREGVSLLSKTDSHIGDSDIQPPSFPCRLAFLVASVGMRILSGPSSVPMGVHRIGKLVFVTLPGEFTTVMGYRIRQAVRERMGPGNWKVVLVGLANEYVSYFTTPEEFSAQEYEGASTLYGQYSASLLLHHAEDLAAKLAEGTPAVRRTNGFNYFAGLSRHFSPSNLSYMEPQALETDIRRVMYRKKIGHERLHRHCWTAHAPDLREVREGRLLATPSVWVESFSNTGNWERLVFNGIPEDDLGTNLVTALAKWDGPQSEWCTFWFPASGLEASGKYRISVLTQDRRRLDSDPF